MNLKRFFNKEYLKGVIKRANRLRVFGFVLVVVGVIFFLLSINAMRKLEKANTLSNNISDFFEHNPDWNPIIEFFGGEVQHEIDYYDTLTLMIQIGGIVFSALGAILITLSYKKKNTQK
jgi:hypothetical protein